MADSKVTALTELTALDGDEQFYVVDDDDGTPTSKRITTENLRTSIPVAGTYGAGWNGSNEAPTKNDVYDKIETFGVWTTYTPTWDAGGGTGPVLNNGTIAGYYTQLGKMLFLRISLKMGTTTTYGDGSFDWRWSLPAGFTTANLPASGPRQPVGSVYALDAGTAHIVGVAAVDVNATVLTIYNGPATGTGTGWKQGVPITWTTNDSLAVMATIHIA